MSELKKVTRQDIEKEVRKESPDQQDGWIGQVVDERIQRARANGSFDEGFSVPEVDVDLNQVDRDLSKPNLNPAQPADEVVNEASDTSKVQDSKKSK